MLVLLRIIFTGAFFYCVVQARDNARENLAGGDLNNALWVALGVISAIAAAAAWAQYLGAKVADPLTGGLVDSPLNERKNWLLQSIRWLEKKKKAPGCLRLLCFIEGVRAPWLPTAFNIGLRNARPGSWLEKVYAREVFRFNNVENCVRAFEALQRHGIDPRPHNHPEVNTILLSRERETTPERPVMEVPPAPPPPPLQRNPRIQIGKE